MTKTDKSSPPTRRDRGGDAREKLIEAGLKIFSETGYEGASTRKLAAAAAVNIAAIPYYFGNKEGLYLAVIDHIISYYKENLGDALAGIRQALKGQEKTTGTEYRALLDGFMQRLVAFVLRESSECSRISKIYMREQLDPSSGFDRLYRGFIREMRETLEALVAAILGGDAGSSEIKLVVETLIGQVAIFKSSRVTVLHNMGWQRYSDETMAAIERIVRFNVNALIEAYREKDDRG
jgi:AcrR family transcriptional regulator